jgi:flagellar biosynthesis protein FlhB
VVIRNPTHYAIALEYNEKQMDAPKVIAMGQDSLALKIIEIAEENKVQIITNRALAKALYETADIDQEIPLQHYKAVAEIIGYVYKLKGKNVEKKAA